MNNLSRYTFLFQDTETISRWEQSTSWSEYFSLLWMDFSVSWQEMMDRLQCKEHMLYFLDHFSISISVS